MLSHIKLVVLAQIRKSYTYAAGLGRGGEGKMIPGAHPKRGQKVHTTSVFPRMGKGNLAQSKQIGRNHRKK